MTSSNKVLVIIITLAAFIIGVMLYAKQSASQTDTQTLLSAKLLTSNTEEPQTETIAQHLSQLTLINFWASWCAPCRDEMPIFEAMAQQSKAKGFQVIGVAIDSPEKTQAMLDSMGITYPILYAEKTGLQLMYTVGNTQGLLPYSLLVDDNGKVLDQVLGRIDETMIMTWLEEYL